MAIGKWHPFDDGRTLETRGSEGGEIVLDEEYSGLARITLESASRIAPWAITCGIYGSMCHTRFLGEQLEAENSYRAMKDAIARIVDLIPDASEVRDGEKMDEVYNAIDRFVIEFP